MTWVDVLVIGLVGLFIVSRFFAFKLPKDSRPKAVRRTDFSKLFQRHIPADPKTDEAKVGAAPVRAAKATTPKVKKVVTVKKVSAKDLAGLSGLEKIKALDPAFEEKKFLEGAKTAYGYFYKCWNAKDESGLVDLCAPRLVDRVVGEWERKWQKIDVVEVTSATIGEARVSGRTAIVEAVINSVVKNGASKKKVANRWLLARAMGSDDPNWELQEMQEVRA